MGRFLATKGRYFTLDEIDYDLALFHKWSCDGDYFVTRIFGKREFLHNVILRRKGCKIRKGMIGDHIDLDTTNHFRNNLRLITCSQSVLNRRIQQNNTSGLKGVSWKKDRNMWHANLTINRKLQHICFCQCRENAGEAYDLAVILLRKDHLPIEFNFPENREKYLEELKINNIKNIYNLKRYLKKKEIKRNVNL